MQTKTFLKLLEGVEKTEKAGSGDEDGSDERAVTAMSILSTIETVLDMMEEEREITLQLEGIVAPLVAHVLKNRLIGNDNSLLIFIDTVQPRFLAFQFQTTLDC